MKTKLFAILTVPFFLISCSRSEDTIEETPQETPFFNLKVGNEWIYKTYTRPDYTSEFKFSGKIDTLKIVDEVILNNKNYVRVRHSIKNNQNYENYEYWRVNEKGHLLSLDQYLFNSGNDSEEYVKHPGKDFSYSYKQDYNLVAGYMGTILYKLYPNETMTVENHNYTVSPYKGIFTPSNLNPVQLSKTVNSDYVENIGLIRYVNHAVTGTSNSEDRLVSYSLK
ncbi:MAG: hypothetical protein DI529_05985 [Chryseobacterium sp.]|nr:MAG: hypothetical protein DI529_05985 [Chryseobacterium sp.]